MAKHLVDVELNVLEYDADRNRSIVKRTMQVEVDDDFQIDGVSMPTPNFVEVSSERMSESKRLPGNGEMKSKYLGTAFNVTWKYSLINQGEFKLLNDAYIKATTDNKNMFHNIKTLNLSSGDVESIELTIYTEGSFKATPYMNKNGLLYYRDVVLNMTDKAGEV